MGVLLDIGRIGREDFMREWGGLVFMIGLRILGVRVDNVNEGRGDEVFGRFFCFK